MLSAERLRFGRTSGGGSERAEDWFMGVCGTFWNPVVRDGVGGVMGLSSVAGAGGACTPAAPDSIISRVSLPAPPLPLERCDVAGLLDAGELMEKMVEISMSPISGVGSRSMCMSMSASVAMPMPMPMPMSSPGAICVRRQSRPRRFVLIVKLGSLGRRATGLAETACTSGRDRGLELRPLARRG